MDKALLVLHRIAEIQTQKQAFEDDKIFCEEYIKIVNKQGQTVPFQYNNIQKRIDDKIKELEADGKPVRIIILKARQEGVSTYAQAKILCRTAKNKNRNALVVAHRDDSTNAIFEKAKYMYNNLPEHIKPLQKASNARELIFDTPTYYKGDREGLNSRIRVQTAGSESIGRSDTFYYVHLSEFAFWEGKDEKTPIKQLTGILQAVPKILGTFVIIESTANGFNDFKKLWDDAVAGENEWIPLFFAWHDCDEYQMPVTDEERQRIRSSLNEYEKKLFELFPDKMTEERIKWYRWTLKNDCNGDVDMMKQENPSFPEEAFLSTGRPVFDNVAIMARKKHLEKHPIGERGYIEFDKQTKEWQFVPDKTSPLIVYEKPLKNYPYVMVGDVAEGIKGGDYSAFHVMNNVTGNQAAVYKGHIHPRLFANEQKKVAEWYNKALIADEVNNHGLTTVTALEDMGYYKQYKREEIDSITQEKQEKFGWKTTPATRPLIIDDIREWVREHLDLINDIDTLNEMLTFVWKENGKAEHEEGCHDDLVISLAIFQKAREQQSKRVKEDTKPIKRKVNPITGY